MRHQLSSHTHCQSIQANAETKAWQRVSLPIRTTKTTEQQVTNPTHQDSRKRTDTTSTNEKSTTGNTRFCNMVAGRC